jgi:hypothetical protein
MKRQIALILLLVAVSLCVQSPYEREYAGLKVPFRANLNEAEKISVYPSEDSLNNLMLNPQIINVTIYFFPNDTENAYYSLAAFELSNKLEVIYKANYGSLKKITGIPIENNTSVIISKFAPGILFLGPSKANETSVSVNETVGMVTIRAANLTFVDNKYNDLDLAVDKFLMVLMGFK